MDSLTISAATVAFGDVVVNTPAAVPVTLTSTGLAPVTVNSVTVSGTGFTMSGGPFPVMLNSGQSVTVNVQFDPASTGAATGQLTITSDTSTSDPAYIPLSGTGVAPGGTVSTLSCSSSTFTGAGTDACTVTLTAPAASSGLNVSLSSDNAAVTVPATVTVPANATTAGFTATVSSVTTTQTATLTASAGTVSATFVLQLNALNASTPVLSISPTSVPFGNVLVNTPVMLPVTLTSTGTGPVSVNSATSAGSGFTVSGPTLPVTLNPGQTATLNVQFDPAAAGAATGQLTIVSDSSTNGTAMIPLSGTGVVTPGTLSTLSCSSASFTGAGTDACTVTLTGPAVSGGLSVSLSSSSTAVTVPASVTVPTNATTVGFTATISAVTSAQAVTLKASVGTVSATFALQLNAAVPTLTISATNLAFGNVALNTPAMKSLTLTSSGTAPVTVSSVSITGIGFTDPGAAIPVTLNPGQIATLNVQFDPTAAGAATGQLTITSNSSTNGTAMIPLTGTGVSAGTLSALSCSSSSFTSSGTDACTVTLAGPAGSGGVIVSLSSNNSQVTVPAAVTVPANATSAGFTATVSLSTSAQTVTLMATAGTVSATFSLQLSAGVRTLSINATSVPFGDVLLNTPTTQSLTLTSSGSLPVTVSAATITGTGFTDPGAVIPVTLNPTQTATLEIQFDPTTAVAYTGQLTIISNSSTNGTALIPCTGTGITGYIVDLTWDAPVTSADPVAGYNVYRAPAGGTVYQLLNSTVVTTTSYVDSTVQNGLSYDYYVESVDASGVQSVPSNLAVVPIP